VADLARIPTGWFLRVSPVAWLCAEVIVLLVRVYVVDGYWARRLSTTCGCPF